MPGFTFYSAYLLLFPWLFVGARIFLGLFPQPPPPHHVDLHSFFEKSILEIMFHDNGEEECRRSTFKYVSIVKMWQMQQQRFNFSFKSFNIFSSSSFSLNLLQQKRESFHWNFYPFSMKKKSLLRNVEKYVILRVQYWMYFFSPRYQRKKRMITTANKVSQISFKAGVLNRIFVLTDP